MDSIPAYITVEPSCVLSGSFSPDGRFVASTGPDGVRVVGLVDDDRDSLLSAWRCTLRDAGFAPSATVATLLLVRRDRAGDSHLALWTPGAGTRDVGSRFAGDIDAWWSSDGRILVRALGAGAGGMWVVDPRLGVVVAA